MNNSNGNQFIYLFLFYFLYLNFRNNRRIRAKEIIYSRILRKYINELVNINDLVTNKAS